MTHGLQFRWADPHDRASLETFVAETYGHDAIQSTPGRVAWLYFAHPDGPHVILCEDAGRLVACCGHLPVVLRAADRELTAAFGIDMIVAATHRRRGIAHEFVTMRLERYDVGLSTGQSDGMSKVYTGFDVAPLGRWFTATGVRRPRLAATARATVRDALAWARSLACQTPAGQRIPLDLDEAVAIADSLDTGAGLRRNGRWWRWRFGGGIYNDTRSWLLNLDGAPAGLLASRLETGRETVQCLLATPDHWSDALALARATTPHCALDFLAGGPMAAARCRAAGCMVRPRDGLILACSRERGLATAVVSGPLDVQLADSDADLLRHSPRYVVQE